jgi:hypothetical protein
MPFQDERLQQTAPYLGLTRRKFIKTSPQSPDEVPPCLIVCKPSYHSVSVFFFSFCPHWIQRLQPETPDTSKLMLLYNQLVVSMWLSLVLSLSLGRRERGTRKRGRAPSPSPPENNTKRSRKRWVWLSSSIFMILCFPDILIVLYFCSRPSTRRSAARLRSTSEETAPPTATPGSPEDDLTRDLPQPTQPLKVEEVPANQQHHQQLMQQPTNGEGKPFYQRD